MSVACEPGNGKQIIRPYISGVGKLLWSPGVVKCQVKCYHRLARSSVV